jgi:thiamine-monophosphate kinase
MLDVSDGLAGDALHLAAASGVGLDIDLALLPIHPAVHAVAARRGEPAPVMAAIGGEDYELLVTLPPAFDNAAGAEASGGVHLTRIGTVTDGSAVVFHQGGIAVPLEGFQHGG